MNLVRTQKHIIFLTAFVFGLSIARASSQNEDFSQYNLFAQNTPPSSGSLNINDLGFDSQTVAADKEYQDELERRASLMKWHQYSGYATLALMTATLFSAEQVEKGNNLHQYLGIASGVAYWNTVLLQQLAPDARNEEANKAWNIKIHKTLRWISMPLMVLVPVAGYMADKQIKRGEKLHGLAEYKGTLGVAAYATVALSAGVMFFEF